MREKTDELPYRSKGNLIEGPVGRHLVRLSVPMIWGILAIISFQLVNTFFVSLLGTRQLAAISFTFPVTMLVFYLIMGLAIATSSVVSRLIGEGSHEKVVRVTTHSLILSFAIGLVLSAIGLLTIDPLFRLIGAPADLMPLIRQYMVIWYAGSVFVTLPMVGNAAIRASGDSLFPALVMTVAAAVNAALDPVFIFGLFGFPRLELQGAAIVTVLSNGGAMIAGLYVLHWRKKMLLDGPLHMDQFKDSVKRLMMIAAPAGLTNTIMPVTQAVITGLLAAYGHEAVAAFGVVSRVEAFAMVILMALAIGMAPVIGQNWGARKFDRVHETLRLSLGFSALWSLGAAILIGVFAKPLAGIFSAEQNVINITALYFMIVPATYVLGNLVNGWSSAFNAMGMPRRSFMMIAVRMLVLQIPLALLGSHLYGWKGIFLAIAATNIIAGGGFHLMNMRVCTVSEHEKMAASARA